MKARNGFKDDLRFAPNYQDRKNPFKSVEQRNDEAINQVPEPEKLLLTRGYGMDALTKILNRDYTGATLNFLFQNVHCAPSISMKFTDVGGNIFANFGGFIVEKDGEEVFRAQVFICENFKDIKYKQNE